MERIGASQGGAGGLEAVFLAHRAALLRFLRARGAGDAAEDLLQELWLRAAATPSGPIAEPLAYLYRTANNLMLDRRRGEQRAARREDAWGAAVDGSLPGVSDEPSAERALIARERLARAQALLDSLGERTARIFRAFRLDGVAQRDIAAREGISLSAVEKHLRRAYRALLGFEDEPDED